MNGFNNKLSIMKNLRNIFIFTCLLAVASSCVKEDLVNDNNNAKPALGKDVSFTAHLNAPHTKTVYGATNSSSVKVKWVHNDLITVFGTSCYINQAEYAVKTYEKIKNEDGSTTLTDKILDSTPNTDANGQNFADELVKTGTAGIQWGEDTVSDFYAVYPSIDNDFKSANKTGSNGDTITGITVTSTISPEQYNSFELDGSILRGIPYDNVSKKYGMENAIMYACSPDASSMDSSVDLGFSPFSTVLKFTIDSWYGNTANGMNQEQKGKSIVVSSITLTSPENIAGNFPLTLYKDRTAHAGPGTQKVITIKPVGELIWNYAQKLEFSVFTIPLADKMLNENWKVTVNCKTSNSAEATKTFNKTFSLRPNTTDGLQATLAAGEIHPISVKGFPVDAIWEYDPENWITTVPRNIYISDISLPGSWYACDGGYQTGTLTEQYAAGIRAFNIDCRLTLAPGKNFNSYSTESGSMLNRVRKYEDKFGKDDAMEHITDGTLVLACAGTEEHVFASPGIESIGKTVKQALIELGKLAASNQDEFVEVILTIAQKPKDNDYLFSAHSYFGTTNPKKVLTAIANVLNTEDIIEEDGTVAEEGVKKYLYTGQITPETTVGQVCGKLVVKVNVNATNENIKSWNISAPMLVSEGSMSEGDNESQYISGANFAQMNTSSMYWSNKFVLDSDPKYMQFHYHQAQNTTGGTGFPNVNNRKTAILDLVNQSVGIHNSNSHDAMFQIGLGGWTIQNDNNSKYTLSADLNSYLYGIVNSMLTGDGYDLNNNGTIEDTELFTPAPVGAVLMNFVNAGTQPTNGEDDSNTTDPYYNRRLIKAIIALNGKYELNRDETQSPW